MHKVLEFLRKNQNKKVSEILDEIQSLLSSSQRKKNFEYYKNHLIQFCYYHKQFEIVNITHEYGKKSNTSTGYNNMCRKGTNNWTKQNSEIKKKKEQILKNLLEGKIDNEIAKNELEKLKIEFNKEKDNSGFETIEDAKKYIDEKLVN